jgi:hypothetical protein
MPDAPPGVPPRKWTPWRVRSRTCAGIDALVLCVGVLLLVISVVDSVLSWPGNWVLISASRLGPIVAILLVPTWIWVLGSMYFEGAARTPPRDNWYLSVMKSPTVRAFGALALLLLAVLLIDHAIGWANGSLRVLPSGVRQVSTSSLDHSSWTSVSDHQYQVWDARFVREEALVGILALAMIILSLSYLRLHRAVVLASGN